MKTIRSLMVLAGLSVVCLVLGSTGARAQGFSTTRFTGTFTLPVEAQWGTMTLPAGDYSLYYGTLNSTPMAYVIGKAARSPQGLILASPNGSSSATKNSLVCVRNGNSLVVRKLELPVIGKSINFAMPPGKKLLARRQKHGKYTLAEAPMLFQRVPVALSQK